MVKLTGGGISGNKVKQSRSGYKIEPKARAMSPEAVGQQGASLAFPRKALDQGPGYTPGKMGAVDRPSYQGPTTASPGSNRTIYPSGLQAKTPPAREMPQGRTFDERPNIRDRR